MKRAIAMKYEELTKKIIGVSIEVCSSGFSFAEFSASWGSVAIRT